MFEVKISTGAAKSVVYGELLSQYRGIIDGERDALANAANLSALLYQTLPDLNWAGFYVLRGSELVLGPFQGKVACVRITLGKGVCGTSAASRETVVVPDVEQFPGHIACDHASRSEIVIPLLKDGAVIGVMDLDSPKLARFDREDRQGLEALAAAFLAGSDLAVLSGR